ncbi:MAG: hypothetical protein IKB16_11195 [Lentisphaeria bacterium]|nr:hypothetical protein [Lentisphaeria bacterium]
MSKKNRIAAGVAAVVVVLAAVAVLINRTAGSADTEVFKLTGEDEWRISQEFIDQIRAGVGDAKASHASAELHKFVHDMLKQVTGGKRSDLLVYYTNYIERLYNRALNSALEKMSPEEKREVLAKEKKWVNDFVYPYDYELKDKDGNSIFSIVSDQFHFIRLYYNRTKYWESTPRHKAVVDSFQGLPVNYIYGELTIDHNELRRKTPLKLHGEVVNSKEKSYFEDIAFLPVEFCRKVTIGEDVYQIGMLIPSNDIAYERSTHGNERILLIWKNRRQHACYYLPNSADILEVKVKGPQVTVRYSQVDEDYLVEERADKAEQTFTINFTYNVYVRVKITNWQDYHTDALGRIHEFDCCKGKFQL